MQENKITKTKFSVAMCLYAGDDAKHFDVAISSVVNQSVKPTEVVLTIDGPITEELEKVISSYRIKLKNNKIDFKQVRLLNNVGHGEARRVCLDSCSFNLIALMDADDISEPTRFERQLSYFSVNPEVAVVGGFITEFLSGLSSSDTSNKVGRRVVPLDDRGIKEYMKKRCPMNQVTVMFKRNEVAEVGGYMDWYCEEDYYLWIRLALSGKIFGNIPENLVNVRVGRDMYHRRGGWKYFKSEAGIQKLLYKNKIIGVSRYFLNVIERFAIQVVLPNNIRGWIFQKFARE